MIKDFFDRLMEFPQLTRIEVLTKLENLTRNYNQEYTAALLSDIEDQLDDWKYSKDVARLQAEYNEKILEPYYTALHCAEYALANGCNEPIEWPEEPAPFIAPPPGCYDDSHIFVAPMYKYAVEVLKSKLITNSITVIPEETSTLNGLPNELDTDRANKYFARAIEAGYMTTTAAGYKWGFGGKRGAKARLAYFVERVYCPSATDKIQSDIIRLLQQLFGVERLDRAIQQNADTGKSRAVMKWRAEIDTKIFYD